MNVDCTIMTDDKTDTSEEIMSNHTDMSTFVFTKAHKVLFFLTDQTVLVK